MLLTARANRVEHPPRIQRVDRLARGPEDRGIHAGGERRAERIMRGDGDNARPLADEMRQLLRIAHDDLIAAEFLREHRFEDTQPRRCGAGAALRRRRHVAPRRILLVDHPLHPSGNRSEGHLDEEPCVVDALGQGRGQHDWRAGVLAHSFLRFFFPFVNVVVDNAPTSKEQAGTGNFCLCDALSSSGRGPACQSSNARASRIWSGRVAVSVRVALAAVARRRRQMGELLGMGDDVDGAAAP